MNPHDFMKNMLFSDPLGFSARKEKKCPQGGKTGVVHKTRTLKLGYMGRNIWSAKVKVYKLL